MFEEIYDAPLGADPLEWMECAYSQGLLESWIKENVIDGVITKEEAVCFAEYSEIIPVKEVSKIINIFDKIKNAYDYVSSLGYTVAGIFLHGSQNYRLDNKNSDVDTKCIVIPSFDDICSSCAPISTTLILPSSEHIDLKDIRIMFDNILKQNSNYLEILFTQYYYLNPEYEKILRNLFIYRENIARFDEFSAVRCMTGMSFSQRFLKYSEKNPGKYDSKLLAHIVRNNEMLKRYVAGEDFEKCLISNQLDYLRKLKAGVLSCEDAKTLVKNISKESMKIRQDFIRSKTNSIKTEISDLFHDMIKKCLKIRFNIEE